MTLTELVGVIYCAGQSVDRVAGLCDGYDDMMKRCSIEVDHIKKTVTIDTENQDENGYPVPAMIAKLYDEAVWNGDYTVRYSGYDNAGDGWCRVRNVVTARVLRSADGAGVSLRGPEPRLFRDVYAYHTRIVIEDPRAKSLNDTFVDFLKSLAVSWVKSRYFDEMDDVGVCVKPDYTLVSFIACLEACAAVAAMLDGMFSGVYFTITPLTEDDEEYRLSNDRYGRHFRSWRAEFYPAYITSYDDPKLMSVGGDACYTCECDSWQEAEQFIADRKPDASVGDLAQIITTRYIDNTSDIILDDNSVYGYFI